MQLWGRGTPWGQSGLASVGMEDALGCAVTLMLREPLHGQEFLNTKQRPLFFPPFPLLLSFPTVAPAKCEWV